MSTKTIMEGKRTIAIVQQSYDTPKKFDTETTTWGMLETILGLTSLLKSVHNFWEKNLPEEVFNLRTKLRIHFALCLLN